VSWELAFLLGAFTGAVCIWPKYQGAIFVILLAFILGSLDKANDKLSRIESIADRSHFHQRTN
jgi:hypothetical protein